MSDESNKSHDVERESGKRSTAAKQSVIPLLLFLYFLTFLLLLLLQFFVFCHSLLQLAQLLVSGYMKSSISTIERRYGLSSQKSGLLAAFNEVSLGHFLKFVVYSLLDPARILLKVWIEQDILSWDRI